jgi:hypothetical protein
LDSAAASWTQQTTTNQQRGSVNVPRDASITQKAKLFIDTKDSRQMINDRQPQNSGPRAGMPDQ